MACRSGGWGDVFGCRVGLRCNGSCLRWRFNDRGVRLRQGRYGEVIRRCIALPLCERGRGLRTRKYEFMEGSMPGDNDLLSENIISYQAFDTLFEAKECTFPCSVIKLGSMSSGAGNIAERAKDFQVSQIRESPKHELKRGVIS